MPPELLPTMVYNVLGIMLLMLPAKTPVVGLSLAPLGSTGPLMEKDVMDPPSELGELLNASPCTYTASGMEYCRFRGATSLTWIWMVAVTNPMLAPVACTV